MRVRVIAVRRPAAARAGLGVLGAMIVAVAAAVGQPDCYAGELPVAFVTLKAGATVDGEELRRYLAPIVSEPAALPRHVSILSDLPMTPVGKIYKPALRVLAARHAIEMALSGAGMRVLINSRSPLRNLRTYMRL